MDIEFEYAGTTFVWHDAKARDNERKHGVEFFEAVTVHCGLARFSRRGGTL